MTVMNKFATEGHKVIVTDESIKRGRGVDREQADKVLAVGKEYTVKKTVISDKITTLFLDGFGSISFNIENFEDVEPLSKEEEMKHTDWYWYNNLRDN